MGEIPIWKQFENRVKEHSPPFGYTAVPVPDHIIPLKNKLISKKTACDYACGIDGRAVFFDCKTTKSDKFEFSKWVFDKKKVHQWEALLGAYENKNTAGYLVWFYEQGIYAWIGVQVVLAQLELNIKSVSTSTDGVIIMQDSKPLNLRELIYGEV